MEFLIFCRVCLQESVGMQTIFNHGSTEDLMIYEKMMLCSTIKIKPEDNLPDNICINCLNELETAYQFRIKIEDSDKILHSFLISGTTGSTTCGNSDNHKTSYSSSPIIERPCNNNIKLNNIKKEIYNNTEYIDSVEYDDGYYHEIYNSNNIPNEVEEEEPPEEVSPEEVGPPEEEPPEEEEQTNHNDDTELFIDSEDITDNTNDAEICEDNNLEINSQSQASTIDNHQNVTEYFEENPSAYEIYSISVIDDNILINDDSKSNTTTNLILTNNNNMTIDNQPISTEELPIVKTYLNKNNKYDNTKNLHYKYECQICNNRYKFNHTLQTHLRRHRNERPFSCEICNKAFVLNVELNTHMRTHTGLKPYSCRYCDRRYSDFGSRVKHERTHTGERPYVCTECGKSFAYSYGLSGHMLLHTGEKPFGCEKCGKHFNKKHHLKNHIRTHLKNDKKLNYINHNQATPTKFTTNINMENYNKDNNVELYNNHNNTIISGQIIEEIIEETVSDEEDPNDLNFYVLNEDNILDDDT